MPACTLYTVESCEIILHENQFTPIVATMRSQQIRLLRVVQRLSEDKSKSTAATVSCRHKGHGAKEPYRDAQFLQHTLQQQACWQGIKTTLTVFDKQTEHRNTFKISSVLRLASESSCLRAVFSSVALSASAKVELIKL